MGERERLLKLVIEVCSLTSVLVWVGAGDSRTSRGARQGASASINRGGRGDLGTPTPQEPLPQPPAVRPELIRILIV